jgi:hypothetical protein
MTRNLALSAGRFWVCWALDAQCYGLDAQEGRNGWNRSKLGLRLNLPRYSSDLSAPWAGRGSAA